MEDIYLISCTKSKQNYDCKAEDMYKQSSLYRAALQYALERADDKDKQVFILSAKHGLLRLSDVISPYDLTLNNMSQSKRNEWGQTVFAQISQRFDVKTKNFIFLAGNAYTEPLKKYLPHYELPLHGMKLGVRVSWLQKHILSNNDALSQSCTNSLVAEKVVDAEKNVDSAPMVKVENNTCLVCAKDLRIVDNLQSVPKDKPGWYRWWASEKALERLLDSQYVSGKHFQSLLPYLQKQRFMQEDYYYVYVGIAVKESIQARLNWHINQTHSKSSVQSGTLSTLRQSISSLVAGNQYDENATNDLIDMLLVEYSTSDYPVKSDAAKQEIENIEHNEMTANALPLNIRDNKHPVVQSFSKELKKARKNSK